MRNRMLRRLRSAGSERGLSLVELLVTIMLFTIIMALVSGFYISALKSMGLSRDLTENTKTVSNAMSAVSRAVRAGTNNPVAGSAIPDPAFVVAKTDDIVFYAYVNLTDAQERPVMYRFWVDRANGQLREAQWPATALANGRWGFPATTTAPTYSRVIAETVSPYDGDNPVFTFIRANGTEIVPGESGLSLANRQLIVGVRVALQVQNSLTDGEHRVTLVNLVGMPNLGYAREE